MKNYKCEKCGKEFENYRQLNGHKSIHRTGGRYSVSRKRFADKKCIQCNITIPHNMKYCSTPCQQIWRWKNINKPTVLCGNGSVKAIKRYLKEEIGNKCSECGIGALWNNKELTLQLDHIDGNSDNNQIDNVRLLCPNCHTQTPTWGAKGQGSRYKKITKRNLYLREYKK